MFDIIISDCGIITSFNWISILNWLKVFPYSKIKKVYDFNLDKTKEQIKRKMLKMNLLWLSLVSFLMIDNISSQNLS